MVRFKCRESPDTGGDPSCDDNGDGLVLPSSLRSVTACKVHVYDGGDERSTTSWLHPLLVFKMFTDEFDEGDSHRGGRDLRSDVVSVVTWVDL